MYGCFVSSFLVKANETVFLGWELVNEWSFSVPVCIDQRNDGPETPHYLNYMLLFPSKPVLDGTPSTILGPGPPCYSDPSIIFEQKTSNPDSSRSPCCVTSRPAGLPMRAVIDPTGTAVHHSEGWISSPASPPYGSPYCISPISSLPHIHAPE